MTEKITGQGFRPVDAGGPRRSEKTGQTGGQAGAQTTVAAGTDTVNVERTELLLSRLSEALESIPVVDAERVRAVRDAIASGNYQIDAATIADKLIELDRELDS